MIQVGFYFNSPASYGLIGVNIPRLRRPRADLSFLLLALAMVVALAGVAIGGGSGIVSLAGTSAGAGIALGVLWIETGKTVANVRTQKRATI